MNVTPLEIFDYKRNWMPGYKVRLHSDLDVRGKDWCRKNLERHKCSMAPWTAVYEHTFHFEDDEAAKKFEQEFKPYTNQERV